MTGILIELAIVLIGLAVTAVLFYRFPALPAIHDNAGRFPSVSVIIPARNEEANLPLLLGDLRVQTLPPYEVLCVDDASEDATAQVAMAHGAKLISLPNKPEGWTGKTWACQNGANAATGDLLLFLDADVRLGKDGVKKLLQAYREHNCTISVQPYHQTEKLYEQLSMLFNLVQVAANGTALPKPRNTGLYGPVILMARSDYAAVGGHESVRKCVVEDMALGTRLKKTGLPYRLFIGDSDVSFRMYASGLRGLLQGWLKNMAAGAARTPLPVFLMVFFWIASLASVPLQIIKFSVAGNLPWLLGYSALYVVWVAILMALARRIGRFRAEAAVFYPVGMITMLGVFAVSAFRRLFGLGAAWKGRIVDAEGKPCD